MRLEKTATTTFNCPHLHRVASSLLQFFILVILTYALAIAIEKRSYYTPQDCRESGTCDVKIKHEEMRSVISSSNHTDTGMNNNNNNKNSSSSTSPHHYFCPDALYADGKWQGDVWTVNNPDQCRLEDFTKDEFCAALGSRNILIVGDSINRQLFYTLQTLLGATTGTGVGFKHLQHAVMAGNPIPTHTVATICSGSSQLTFLRNDRLLLRSDMKNDKE
jgi:hypothetical protein